MTMVDDERLKDPSGQPCAKQSQSLKHLSVVAIMFCIFRIFSTFLGCLSIYRDALPVYSFAKMEILRMVGAVFSLLLFLQFWGIFASGFAIQSKVCGADHIAYSNSNEVELFYINGNLVDKFSFCKVIQFHYANHCIFEGYSGSDYCRLDLSLAKLSFSPGRKNLQKEVKEEPKTHDAGQNFHPREEKNYSGSLSTTKKVGIAATGLFVMSCALLCPCFYKKRKATAHTVLARDPNSMDSASSLDVNSGSEKVSGADKVPPSPMRVVKATRNFSPSLRIGEGGFGTVYKAQLEDGLLVAIKRAKKEQFENLQTEFSSEVELLSKIDHRNLVKLLGFVDKGNERLIITEFVPNGTLREHLDGQYGKTLDFNQRLEIAIDVAHGLTYLHLYAEKQIIHRDVKSSNILLTESMRAKVADFGFARLGPMDSDRTHISTKVKGTVGYLDPEYMKTYQLTTKSDVYSFGVLLLEILTGRRPVELKRPPEERVTLRWAFKRYNEGNLLDMVDPSIKEVIRMEILTKMFGLAIQCAAPIRNDRPDMKSVGEQLWAIRADSLKSLKKG
ncbi:calmodulin-binding receptor-like cytoplasmic kinase 3 [Citrus sinensis]|uniref:Calmodulin-binding receptor-like cytoplasmic kinase 3 n=1 Tax=Citrus sinensis TaxID=2711 RepID=A0ACB8P4M6_CITSI|nr:calmodulin-binding receptor-like cytoplasmic kinase 3 [Citrus sinensis]